MPILINDMQRPLNTRFPADTVESAEADKDSVESAKGENPVAYPQIPMPRSAGRNGNSEGSGSESGGSAPAPQLPPPARMSIEDMTLQLSALSSKIGEARQQASITEIKGNMAKQTAENKERLAKIQESIDKANDAKKSGMWGKVFGWVATIAAAVLAVALIATGAGALLGGLLLAGALVGLANQIVNTVPALADWAAKNPAFGWVMMGVQIALAVATLGVGIYQAVKATAETTIKAATQLCQKISNYVEGFNAIGQGATGITTGVFNYQAAGAQEQATRIQAELMKLQGLLDDEMARLKKMLEEAQEGFSMCMSILNSATQAKQSIIRRQAV